MANNRDIHSYSPMHMLYIFFCGLCMGAADLVPGISGGTVAFIMGFYHSLLESLKTLNLHSFYLLVQFRFKDFFKAVAWKFLLPLLGGMTCSFILLARLIHFLLENNNSRGYLYALFLGLILASFFFCIRQIKHWSIGCLSGLIIGAILAYLLTGTNWVKEDNGPYAIPIELNHYSTLPLSNYDSQQKLLTQLSASTLSIMLAKEIISLETPVYNEKGEFIGLVANIAVPYAPSFMNLWLIACGIIAVSALLLPGISGSYLLTLLGVYPLVIASLVEFIQSASHLLFNSEAFTILFNLAIGICLGGFLFARFLTWLLHAYHDLTIAILSGLMIGALRSLWPFWSYKYILDPLRIYRGPQLIWIDPLKPPVETVFFFYACLFAIGGFACIYLLDFLVQKKGSA